MHFKENTSNCYGKTLFTSIAKAADVGCILIEFFGREVLFPYYLVIVTTGQQNEDHACKKDPLMLASIVFQ